MDAKARGKYKNLYCTKANNRSERDQALIRKVISENKTVAQIEMIKGRFHRMFDQRHTPEEAMEELCLCYEWSLMIGAEHLTTFWSLLDKQN